MPSMAKVAELNPPSFSCKTCNYVSDGSSRNHRSLQSCFHPVGRSLLLGLHVSPENKHFFIESSVLYGSGVKHRNWL